MFDLEGKRKLAQAATSDEQRAEVWRDLDGYKQCIHQQREAYEEAIQ